MRMTKDHTNQKTYKMIILAEIVTQFPIISSFQFFSSITLNLKEIAKFFFKYFLLSPEYTLFATKF